MRKDAWYQRPAGLLVLAVLLPPVGLILLWLRAGTGIGRKLLGSLAIAMVSVAYIHLFYGIRVEVDGSGVFPIISLYEEESHYQELERSRGELRAETSEAPATAAGPETAVAKASESRTDAIEEGAPEPGSPLTSRAYWTDFRGPNRDGRYAEMRIRADWPSSGLPLLWRQPVGGGYASFVIADGKAFTIEQRRSEEVVAAYDMETGREIWSNSRRAEFTESMGGDGPRATPTWEGGRLYALGATGELRCLNAANGKVIWSKNILTDNLAPNLHWGMAASPLIVDDKIIVLPGGASGKSVVAYDKLSGKPIWKVLNDKQAYTSPMLVTLAGQRQILVVSAERAMGLSVNEGSLLWDYPWVTEYGINAAQPILVSENRILLSAGYGHGAALVEVNRAENSYQARTIWQNTQLKNKFTSSVLFERHVYGLDEAILACVDVNTGERKWKGGRYGYGQILLAGNHVIVLTESGDLALVEATPERHHEVARFSAISGKTWNHPAISEGRLLVRNTTEMACFRIAAL